MRRCLLSLLGLLAAACSSPTSAPALRHLDRPGDVAFGCTGVFPEEQDGTFAGPLPPLACPAAGTIPGADAGVPGAATGYSSLAFVLEPVRGALSIAVIPNGGFIDSDRYAPGLNGVAVGRQPVAVTSSTEGCWAVTANAGSCDLAKIDVVKATNARLDAVSSLPVLANTTRILARPTMVVARQSLPTTTRSSCAGPSEVYVSFESCHLLARVNLIDGKIIDGVLSLPGEAPRIVGPDEISCPKECSDSEIETGEKPEGSDEAEDELAKPQEVDLDAGPSDAGVPDAPVTLPTGGLAPSALAIEGDNTRLYTGGPGSSSLLITDLDAEGRPIAVSSVQLEGGVGIKRISPSGPIPMGNSSSASPRRFVYAIATDGSVRVVEVTANRANVECDTQLDRRYLHDERNISLMACFPVGRAANPPRRADADGPGIRLPRDVLPLDVAFIRPGNMIDDTADPDPELLNGVFAYITAVGPILDSRLGRGLVYVVNVDDDNYADTEANVSYNVDIGLALPHSLRDMMANRAQTGVNGCLEDTVQGTAPVRVEADPTRESGFIYSDTGTDGDPFAPGLRRVLCPSSVENAPYMLQASADPAIRRQAFTDLEKVAPRSVASGTSTNEAVVVVWEGQMSFDTARDRRGGGKLSARSSTVLDLAAPGGMLCSLGGKVGDIVDLLGCEADGDCAFDEKCVFHPDSPQGLPGMCAPRDRQIEYQSDCRDLLVSQRSYTVLELYQDRAVITPRPEILPGTPVEGCTTSEQCVDIEAVLLERAEEAQELPPGTFQRHRYTCERDVAMGGPRRCLAACDVDEDCTEGSICVAGRCMLAPVPSPECMAGLQRYELRGGDTFMVLSSLGTFEHRQRVEEGTGRCVEDTSKSPLIGNRIRRIEPDCQGEEVSIVAPNPCHLPNLTEPVEVDGFFTQMRPSYGMRIRSPGLTIDVSDVAARLREFPSVLISNIPTGFAFQLDIVGGFAPFTFALSAALPERIRSAPDGSVWVVDSGDASGGLTRGQVFRMNDAGLDTLTNRLR